MDKSVYLVGELLDPQGEEVQILMDSAALWMKARAHIEACVVTQLRQGLSQFRVGTHQNRSELVDWVGTGSDGRVTVLDTRRSSIVPPL